MAHLGLIRHTKNIYLENRAHQRAQEGEIQPPGLQNSPCSHTPFPFFLGVFIPWKKQ